MNKHFTLALLLSLLFSNSILAVDYVYNGPGTWNTPSAWQGGLIPLYDLAPNNTITINASVATENYFSGNWGTITVSSGATLTINHMSVFDNDGTINVYGILNNQNDYSDFPGSTLNVYGQVFNHGSFISEAMFIHGTGTFTNWHMAALYNTHVYAGGNIVNNGTFYGNAILNGNFNNASTLAPGYSPGSYTITGNYTAASNAVHNFEVGGTTSANFDYLTATGSINLNGALNVTLINGFTPSTPHDIIIMSGSISGAFASVNIPAPYTLVYTPTTVLLRNSAVLPVNFVKLDVKKQGNNAQISWDVKEENQVDYYEVEKTYNGRDYSTIAMVKASNQNTYNYLDVQPGSTCFYRIKSIDSDGKYKYSPVVNYKNGRSSVQLKAFPMPGRNSITLYHPLSTVNSRIELFSSEGKLIKSFKPGIGTNQTTLDISNLRPGFYLLSIVHESGENETIQIIKE